MENWTLAELKSYRKTFYKREMAINLEEFDILAAD